MKLVGDIAGGAADLGGKLRDRFTGGGGDGGGGRRPEPTADGQRRTSGPRADADGNRAGD